MYTAHVQYHTAGKCDKYGILSFRAIIQGKISQGGGGGGKTERRESWGGGGGGAIE